MIFVGVDIGSCAVKAVAIKKTNKAFQVLQTHFFPIKADADEKQKKLLISSHLKTLADLYQNQEVKYIFCLPQNEISTDTLIFPFKERYKIMKSLPYQIEDKLSLFDYKNLISDIKMTDFSEGKKHVLVFSAFKENISLLLQDIKSAGITPFLLTCEASALSNLFEQKTEKTKKNPSSIEEPLKDPKKKENPYLYLKIGHTHTTAMTFVRDQLRSVYSFEWGVSSCIRKIATKYEIPFHKAMEQFCEKAFVLTHTEGYKGSQIEFSKMIQKPFINLMDKLRLFLLQMEGEQSYKCKKIFLCGGGAQVRNLQTLLSAHLNIPVSRVEHSINLPNWNFRHNNEKQNNLITAVGAAMEGLKKPKNPAINFLKKEFAVQFNSFSFMFKTWKQPLIFGLSVFILLSFYTSLRMHQSQKLSNETNRVFQKKARQIVKLMPKQISIDRVKTFIDSKKKRVWQAQLTEELSYFPSALDKIKTLSVAIKKSKSWNLEIQELNITGDKIEIQGNIIAQYLKPLEKNLTDLAIKGSLKSLLKEEIKNKIAKEQSKERPVIGTKPTDSANPDGSVKRIDPDDPNDQAQPTDLFDSIDKLKSTDKNENNTVFFKYSFIQKQG